jgi:hypothetical protein
VNPPQFGEMFDFAKELAEVMESFVLGVGFTTEELSDTADWRLDKGLLGVVGLSTGAEIAVMVACQYSKTRGLSP